MDFRTVQCFTGIASLREQKKSQDLAYVRASQSTAGYTIAAAAHLPRCYSLARRMRPCLKTVLEMAGKKWRRRKRAVTRGAAEAAVQTLLRWAGDDPHREGLRDTPKRVVNAYRDWFSGYARRSERVSAAHVRGGRRLR